MPALLNLSNVPYQQESEATERQIFDGFLTRVSALQKVEEDMMLWVCCNRVLGRHLR